MLSPVSDVRSFNPNDAVTYIAFTKSTSGNEVKVKYFDGSSYTFKQISTNLADRLRVGRNSGTYRIFVNDSPTPFWTFPNGITDGFEEITLLISEPGDQATVVSSFDNPGTDYPLTSTYDGDAGKGSISINIDPQTWSQAPYHYLISTSPIPGFETLYDLASQDTLNTVDSTEFYSGTESDTAYLFDNLQTGTYYVSVFDSDGQLLYGTPATVMPGDIFTSDAVQLHDQRIYPLEEGNFFAGIDYLTTEYEKTVFKIRITDNQSEQFVGLAPAGLASVTATDFEYGFKISGGTVSSIEGGTDNGENASIAENAVLTIQFDGSDMHLLYDGTTLLTSTPGSPFVSQITILAEAKPAYELLTLAGPVKKKYTYHVASLTHGDCSGNDGHITFSIFYPGLATVNGCEYNITNTATNTIVATYTNYYTSPALNLPPGNYTITGYIDLSTGPLNVSESFSIGYYTEWNYLVDYVLAPNTYSLEKNSSDPAYSLGLSDNLLHLADEGWVEFTPVLTNPSTGSHNFFKFNTINTGTTTPGTQTIYLVFFGNGTQRYMAWHEAGTNTTSPPVAFAAGSRIRLKFNLAGSMEVYINGNQQASLSRNSQNTYLMANSFYLSDGFDDIIASFGCGETQDLGTVSYSKLLRRPDGGYAQAVEGTVKFFHTEEYAIETGKYLSFSIYDDNHTFLAGSDIDGNISASGTNTVSPLSFNFDDNRYELDITGIDDLAVGDYFLIEVETTTGDKRYLRVYYKN